MPHRYNFSGHPVEGWGVEPCVGMNFPAEAKAIHTLFRELLLRLPGREDLLAGETALVILPGLSQAAAIFLAEWHGQFGNWPTIQFAVRKEGGFDYPDSARANLNDIRDSARTARAV